MHERVYDSKLFHYNKKMLTSTRSDLWSLNPLQILP